MKQLTILVSFFFTKKKNNFLCSVENKSEFDFSLFLILVTKPTSKSYVERPPPPRPSQPSPAPLRSSIPPPKPANTPPARPSNPPAPLSSHSDGANAMPDIAQPEVDLLNMLPRSSVDSKGKPNISAKEASFDLLGSFETNEAVPKAPTAMPDLLSESQVKSSSQGLDDLFGAFAPTNSNNAATAAAASNIPDLSKLGLNFNATNTASSSNFDPFGNASGFIGNAELLRPTSTETSPSSATHSKPPPTSSSASSANKDPFADLTSGLNLGWGSQQSAAKPATAAPSPHATQYSSPTHQFGGFVPNAAQQARSPMENQPPSSSQSQKPDYSRSHFETKSKQNGAGATSNGNGASTAGASGTGDIFADILGQQGYNFATKSQIGPRSINEMRKEELVKDMDPDKLKIMEWVSFN